MRKIVFTLFLSLAYTAINAQNRMDSLYEERGVIPEWVKNKTTPEEYQLWETLSQYYRINYDVLKNPYLTEEAKADIYGSLRITCDELQSGKRKTEDNSMFAATCQVAPGEETAYSTEQAVCTKKKYLIHGSINGYDVHVELTIWYIRDEETGTVEILKHAAKGISFSNMPVEFKESQLPPELVAKHGSRVTYNADSKRFDVYYSGTLYFTDNIGIKHEEHIFTNISLKP